MADVADACGAAPPLAAKPSTSKKVAKPKKPAQPAEHPKYREMITSAIRSLKDRKGSSRQAILKHVLANNKVGNELNKINSRVKMALRAGIKSGSFKQVRGTGASGSFRLGEKLTNSADKPKTTKTARKVVKKPALKKAKTSGKTKVASAGIKKAVAKSKKPKSAVTKKLKNKSPRKTTVKKPKAKSPAKKIAKPKKMVKKNPAKKLSKPKTYKK